MPANQKRKEKRRKYFSVPHPETPAHILGYMKLHNMSKKDAYEFHEEVERLMREQTIFGDKAGRSIARENTKSAMKEGVYE